MAKISLVIAIIVTLVTAGLAFVTKTKVDGIHSSLKAKEQEIAQTNQQLTKTKGDLKKSTDELADATKQVDDQKSKITSLEGDVSAAKAAADKAKADGEENAKLVASLKEDLDKAKSTTPTVDPNAPNPAVDELTQKNANLEKELAEAKQVQETLKQREKEADEKVATYQRQLDQKLAFGRRNSVQGRVLAVNPGWNFVVVSVGDKQGSSVNTPLLVMRSGQLIARLKVTSVEPSSSIADIIGGSVARGASVEPGDQVVFGGGRAQSAPAEAPVGSGAATTAPVTSAVIPSTAPQPGLPQ